MKRWILHPFLLAAYPVLALLSYNIEQVKPTVVIRPLMVALLAAGVLLLMLRGPLHDWHKAALACSLVLILFFTYGHIYNFLETSLPFLGRHRLLLPVWLVLFGLGMWLVLRLRETLPVNQALNLIAVVLLVFPALQVANFEFRLLNSTHTAATGLTAVAQANGQKLPDVYYIILDEYTRSDVLEQVYHYDNSAFLSQLKQLGFTVAACSQSNYAQTELALSTTLNLNYLDKLGQFASDSTDRSHLRSLIKDSLVWQEFKKMGYRRVAFQTGFYFSELEDADVYYAPANKHVLAGLSNFEAMLVRTTAALALSDLSDKFLASSLQHPVDEKRIQVSYDFETLRRVPNAIPGPKFVFAHILLPHEPFVFGPQGEAQTYPENMDPEAYAAGYRNQIDYLNRQVIQTMQAILNSSNPSPIIIMQGDTGPGRVSNAQRMMILNAYHFPGKQDSIYSSITPVNSFRLMFDDYFGGSLGLLEDKSRFSLYTSPYQFSLVGNDCHQP